MEYLDCDKTLITSLIDDLRKKNKELTEKVSELEKKNKELTERTSILDRIIQNSKI
tara:strand:- start:787 stop:954 length:168 start_codon:yes stop_codon:yes gene_type:complete